MEQRVQQFHDDTKGLATLAPVKAVKGMNTLRKFIHRNQDYRFSDKEKNKLFACIEAYFTVFDRSPTSLPETTAFPLIEDALKVPCFTTKQKGQMLKWYEEILAKQDGGTTSAVEEKGRGDEEENYDDFDWDEFAKTEGREEEREA